MTKLELDQDIVLHPTQKEELDRLYPNGFTMPEETRAFYGKCKKTGKMMIRIHSEDIEKLKPVMPAHTAENGTRGNKTVPN